MSAAGSTPGRKGSIRLCRSIEMRHVRYAWSNRIARAHRILLTSVLPATLTFSTTAAELECRGKDISGATSCWSKSSSAALHSFPINLVDLPDVIVGGIRHRLRNNAVSHYRVTLNPGDLTWSWLSLEVAGTAFGPATTRYFEDRETQQPFFQKIASTPARHRPCRESKNGHLLAQFEDVIRRAVGAVEAGLAMACSGTRKVAWPEP